MERPIENGITIIRAGDAHPQGRQETKSFEFREGTSYVQLYQQVLDTELSWAKEQGVDAAQLASSFLERIFTWAVSQGVDPKVLAQRTAPLKLLMESGTR